MKTIYFECNTGVSGDMTVGALLDLGANQETLVTQLESLGLAPHTYQLKFSRTKKAGIDAFDFDVLLEESTQKQEIKSTHDHINKQEQKFSCNHPHEHEHSHGHDHEDAHYTQSHRGLAEILTMIAESAIAPSAKRLAEKTFRIIAKAEAKAHGVDESEVHFHEVGAVDSIVDIVGAAICLADLKVDRVICSPLSEGVGTVRCAHGIMPVPVPAVANIAISHNVPLTITTIQGELVTPTGIALMCAMADRFERPTQMNIQKIGYGAGNKELTGCANVVRAFLLKDDQPQPKTGVTLIETNIDDQSPETLSFACTQLLEAGALDVWTTPIVMKKGRVAHMLSVLSTPQNQSTLILLIFSHTSSIGVRIQSLDREIMERREQTVSTKYGDIALKHCEYQEITKNDIEFETLKQASLKHGVSIETVMAQVQIKLENGE